MRREQQQRHCETTDAQYKRVYCELRNRALSDIKRIVREYVEKMSTTTQSYEFMNIYGLCSFNPPKNITQNKEASTRCRFTNISCSTEDNTSTSDTVVSVSGVLNPLMSSRVQHGELELTHCRDSDYYNALEEFTRLDSRNKLRSQRVYHSNLGGTISSMENGFIFTVREDLHNLGCAYRQMIAMVELLHMTLIHYVHS
ncbi:hypothetical protein WMY93_011362 [Mugilogobius chulae]|uniref:Uncharacterized protein n=1 Tax=Mugilogobius chulae TaxID=88201 RepID=A0AAW0PDI3_9GOBI